MSIPQRIQYGRNTDIQQWYRSDHLELPSEMPPTSYQFNCLSYLKNQTLPLLNITMDPDLFDPGCYIIDAAFSYISERLTFH